MLWLVLAVPATLGIYGWCFRGGWGAGEATGTRGEVAAALGEDAAARAGREDAAARLGGSVLRGITSVWVVLTAGVLLSLLACLVAGSALPGVWPGVLMLMLLVLARPSVSPALAG